MNDNVRETRDLVVVKLDYAKAALAEAKTIQEAKQIADLGKAMKVYAREQKLGQEVEQYARSIFLEAIRLVGEMLQKTDRNVGTRGQLAGSIDGKGSVIFSGPSEMVGPENQPPTLAEIGLTYKESALASKIASLPKEEFEQVKEGVQTLTKAFAHVNRERNIEIARQQADLPSGKFSTIIIDPPWPMQKIEREVRPNQAAFDYPTMTEEELREFGAKIELIAADACHLFMWTTQKFLPLGLSLLDDYGFRYILTMVWHKPGGFQPVGLPQYNCEFVLYARRGAPIFVDTADFNCCFEAPRREHSRKPHEFYNVIRRVTLPPRIDVFSRESHEGFGQYGNEPAKFAVAS